MTKPRLSCAQIGNMSFGFLGLQFGFGRQLANMSASYAKRGADPSKIPILWVAATMLWVLAASINVSMEPFRAFVADKRPDAQRTLGFVRQSFFIGSGAAVANARPARFESWRSCSHRSPTALAGDTSTRSRWGSVA